MSGASHLFLPLARGVVVVVVRNRGGSGGSGRRRHRGHRGGSSSGGSGARRSGSRSRCWSRSRNKSRSGSGSGSPASGSPASGSPWLSSCGIAHTSRSVDVRPPRSLLDRARLRVRVIDDDVAGESVERTCRPLDYASLSPGASVKRTIDLGGGQTALCNLCVLSSSAPASPPQATASTGPPTAAAAPPGTAPSARLAARHGARSELGGTDQRGARFFAGGRRIKACGATPSFARHSTNRWTVWSHPQVVGYIDIVGTRSGPLQPVITRDEFKNVSWPH